MLNTLVSIGNVVVGRLLGGVLTLSLDNPFVLCAILLILVDASCAVLLETVAARPTMEPAAPEMCGNRAPLR